MFGVGGTSAPPGPDPQELLSRALAAVYEGHRPAADEAIATLTAQCRPGAPVCAALSAMLVTLMTGLWQAGWQPADVHRVTERSLGEVSVALVRDAMAAQLATYAAATVPPRWRDQMQVIDAETWWEPSDDLVSARMRLAGLDRLSVVEGFVLLMAHLSQLPRLEMLGALPGEYRERRGPTVHVEEKILTRVRRMLAKAESTTFEAEAETFTEAAQKLMARHSIDQAMLADTHGGEDTDAIRLGVERPYEKEKMLLLTGVANANRCQAVWMTYAGFATVIGFPDDVRATDTLYTSLLVQSTRAMTQEGSRRHIGGGSRTRSFRTAFLRSFAHRIGERLAAATEAETRAWEAENAASLGPGWPGEPSRDLVRVLDDRRAEVDEARARLFPHLTHTRMSGRLDAEGWHAGRRAADTADVGAASALPR